jgi:hypothetical protein
MNTQLNPSEEIGYIRSASKAIPTSTLDPEKNIYGSLKQDTFLNVSKFDVRALAKPAEELLKQTLMDKIIGYNEIGKKEIDYKIPLTSIVGSISDDLKLLATPKLPLFNHMTLDDIKGENSKHDEINRSVSQHLAESLAGDNNVQIKPIISSKEIGAINSNFKEELLTNQIDTDLEASLNAMDAASNALNNSPISSLIDKNITSSNKHLFTAQNMMSEFLKCRMSALYFIENYISVPVAGGRVPIRESEQWNSTDKYKIIVDLFQQHDAVLYMSSRQSGKTTTSAMYLLWCMIFFPKLQISYLTLDKNRAIDMISRMKEMMDSLPKWLQVRPKSNAERLSYYELANGSKITASFVSGSNDPDKVGRGLSSPVVFIDETAFIPHAEIVWGALQPSVSAAKIFAKKNGYPNGVIFTSTPNGAGSNFFYNVYQNSVKFDDIYDYENKRLHDNYQQEFLKPEKNSFISVVLHWSEFRSQEWYEQQRKELNFNQRKISQELDLSFLGSDTCIFSDEVIAQLIPKKRIGKITLPYGCELDLYDEIDPEEKYYLGVDTAMSASSGSDYSAIVLMRASDEKPVGEFHGRFSVVKRYAQVVKALIKSLKILYGLGSDNLCVVIERNSIGKEVVEELIYDESHFDYEEYLFFETTEQGEKIPGLYTSNSGKMGQGKRDKMFSLLIKYVNTYAGFISGPLIIDELRNLEQKVNGRIEASRNQHDDIVMAWNFCLYARNLHVLSGHLYIKGESRGQAITTNELLNVISSGTSYNSILNSTRTETFQEVNREILNKMAGLTKVDLKETDEERQAFLKALSAEAGASSMAGIFGGIETYTIEKEEESYYNPNELREQFGNNFDMEQIQNIKPKHVQQNEYKTREEFDPGDYFIL